MAAKPRYNKVIALLEQGEPVFCSGFHWEDRIRLTGNFGPEACLDRLELAYPVPVKTSILRKTTVTAPILVQPPFPCPNHATCRYSTAARFRGITAINDFPESETLAFS